MKKTNKIKNVNKTEYDNKEILDITVKNKEGKIIYQNKVYGGVACFLEDDKLGEGNYQHLSFGHPYNMLFAFEMISKGLKESDFLELLYNNRKNKTDKMTLEEFSKIIIEQVREKIDLSI